MPPNSKCIPCYSCTVFGVLGDHVSCNTLLYCLPSNAHNTYSCNVLALSYHQHVNPAIVFATKLFKTLHLYGICASILPKPYCCNVSWRRDFKNHTPANVFVYPECQNATPVMVFDLQSPKTLFL